MVNDPTRLEMVFTRERYYCQERLSKNINSPNKQMFGQK